MALIPTDKRHEAQIAAGTTGRRRGHDFEKRLAEDLNLIDLNEFAEAAILPDRIVEGQPALQLLAFVLDRLGRGHPDHVHALWLGGLATDRAGDHAVKQDGARVTATKSDVLIELAFGGEVVEAGVSVKTCNNRTPTNAQLYFTTARAFCALLRLHDIEVSGAAERGMQKFCGDAGFRPADLEDAPERESDPSRWYWEELGPEERRDLERLFTERQDDITRTLLKYAYVADPYPPDFIMHQRLRADTFDRTPLAFFTVEELVELSRRAGGFSTREYRIRKGAWKGDPATHLAPRIGFVQFQRGGQKQHPTQLQFNLQAGYFNRLPDGA